MFLEIPLFHVLNARITFGNIFALDEPVPGVTPIKEEKVIACVLDDSCFDTPAGYVRLGEICFNRTRVHYICISVFAISCL